MNKYLKRFKHIKHKSFARVSAFLLLIIFFVGAFIIPGMGQAALTEQYIVIDTEEEFLEGGLGASLTTNGNTLMLQSTEVDFLSNNGGGTWSRKKDIDVNNFSSNVQVRFNLLWDSDMQIDFDDIRFYDETADVEIPYWIESKIDSNNADIWFKPGENNNITLYYGNPSATASSSVDSVVTDIYYAESDFSGTQGYRSWFYQYYTGSAYGNMSWTGTRWQQATYCYLRSNATHPTSYDSARKWISNGSYRAVLFGTIRLPGGTGGTACSTGIIARIYKNSSSLFSQLITDASTHSYDVQTTVNNEDAIYFRVNQNGNNNCDTTYFYNNVALFEAAANEPTISLGVEETASSGYVTSGTYSSPEDANVLDMNWIGVGSWDANPNFEAEVTIPVNTSIAFSARSGKSDGLGGITWDTTTAGERVNGWVDLGTAIYTDGNPTTFTGDNTAWDDLPDDPPDNWRYVQIKASFTSDGSDTPILTSYTITYGTDITAPTNPSSASAWTDSGKGTGIINSSFTNEVTPYLEISGVVDEEGGSGIDCYYIYFGDSDSADPYTAGLEHDGGDKCFTLPNVDLSNVDTNPLDTASSGDIYYLRVRVSDNAGNLSTTPVNGSAIFTYKYDETAPTSPTAATKVPIGYTPNNSYSYNWTGNEGTDEDSGISYYQYKTSVVGSDWVNLPVGVTKFENVAFNPAPENGENTLYIRAVDNAGNYTDTEENWYADTFYYSANAPEPPDPGTLLVTPNSNTENSFTFCWNEHIVNAGLSVLKYQYVVNEIPTYSNVVPINLGNEPETPASDNLSFNAECPNTGDTYDYVYGPISAATKHSPESNTFYLMAVDSLNNVSYAEDNRESVAFIANTTAPSAPLSPSIADVSNREIENWALAISWQEPTFFPAGSSYKVYRSENGTDYELRGTSQTTTFAEAGLTQGATYYYQIYAVDNAGATSPASSVVSDQPTGKYTEPPTIVSGPDVTATAVGAVVTWSTNRASSSFVEYSKDDSYSLSNGSLTATTDHTVSLSGLDPSSTYNFRVQSLDEERDYAASAAYSQNYTFVTSTAPGISEVEVSDVSLNSAIVTWKTTSSATSQVKYGTSTSYGNTITDRSGSSVTKHTIKLSDLSHSTTYNFKITGTDIDGNYMESDNYIFSTLIYPRISNVRFEQQKNTATSTLKVTWESNVPLSSVVEFRAASGGATKEASKSKLTEKHEILVTGLSDNTEYVMTAKGRDSYGNLATSDANRVKTDFDTRPPEVSEVTTETDIQGFGIDAKGQLVVSWETDEASTSQVEYGIGSTGDYTSRTQEDSAYTTSHVVIISELKTSSPYHFRVISKDASGNEGSSGDTSVLTPQATKSIFDAIIDALSGAIGWLFE
ncbi:MAG: DUF2341 domain-containing protein [Patescibacteria group bacterium]|nr:DUF2341 domain-containing protein [Patescibacteria group bacterium]